MPYRSPSFRDEFPCGDYRSEPVSTAAAHAPAVVRQVFDTLLEVFLRPRMRTVSADGRRLVVEDGRPLARLLPSSDDGPLDGLDRIGSASAHRLVRFLVSWQHAHFRWGGRNGRLPPIEGGVDGLCRFMGVKGGRFRDDISVLLRLFAQIAPLWADELEEPMLTSFAASPPGRSKGSLLRIQTTAAIAPAFLFGSTTPEGARLTGRNAFRPPVPRRMPPSSRPNDAAAASMIELLIIRMMRDEAAEVQVNGGLTLHVDQLEGLAGAAATSLEVVVGTLAWWHVRVAPTHATVRVLEMARSRVRLGFGDTLEAMYMREGADRTIIGRQRQATGERQKRADRARRGP